ncbi:MAG: response regulator transcription factor [Dokdonella sp.]
MRVLLVDDHAVVREGLRAVLEDQPDITVIGECASGDEALRSCNHFAPDVVLLDLKMPGIGPVETILGLRERLDAVRILVFTSFGDDATLRAILDAGANGFLLKDASQSELLLAIRSVAAGQPYLAPAAQRQLMEMLRHPTATVDVLTARETEVLAMIAQGLSNKRIAERLRITEGTVKGYVSQILAKLHVADRTQAALYAVRNKLVGE